MSDIKPAYLISGGPSADRAQLVDDLRTALESGGGAGLPVVYVGTANHDDGRFFSLMEAALLAAGAGSVTLAPIWGDSADIEEARRLLAGAEVIFLSGGEPEDGMEGLRKAGLAGLLEERYREGALYVGISAGAIMMGEHWVHWDVKGDDSTARLIDCLGFFPMTFDAHGEQEDWKDLRCALSLMGSGSRGYGLSNDGFYQVDGEGNLMSFRNGPDVIELD